MGTTKSCADNRSASTQWGTRSYLFTESQISAEKPHLYEVDAIFGFLDKDNGDAVINNKTHYAVFDCLRWLNGGIISREESAYSSCCKHSNLGLAVDDDGKRLPMPIMGIKESKKGNLVPDGEWETFSSPLKRTPIKVGTDAKGEDLYILHVDGVQYLRVKAVVPYFVPDYQEGVGCKYKTVDGEEIAILKRSYKPVWEVVPDNKVPIELKQAIAAIKAAEASTAEPVEAPATPTVEVEGK